MLLRGRAALVVPVVDQPQHGPALLVLAEAPGVGAHRGLNAAHVPPERLALRPVHDQLPGLVPSGDVRLHAQVITSRWFLQLRQVSKGSPPSPCGLLGTPARACELLTTPPPRSPQTRRAAPEVPQMSRKEGGSGRGGPPPLACLPPTFEQEALQGQPGADVLLQVAQRVVGELEQACPAGARRPHLLDHALPEAKLPAPQRELDRVLVGALGAPPLEVGRVQLGGER